MVEVQGHESVAGIRTTFQERHNFGRGEVEMLRVAPDTARRDSETDPTDLPLLFAHGHGQDKHLLRQLRSFAAAGEDVFGAAFVGPRRSIKWLLRRRDDIGAKAPDYQVDKAEDMMEAMGEIGVAQADVVATSEGALRTMIAVAKYPEKFQDIILVHPAGMDDKGVVRTHGRVAYNYGLTNPAKYLRAWRASRSRDKQADVQVSVPWFKRFITKTAEKETVALSRFHELAAELKQAHPHLNFLIIGDESDRIYPPDRLREVNPTIPVVTSNWGGHGIRNQQSVNEIVGHLRGMKQARNAASKS